MKIYLMVVVLSVIVACGGGTAGESGEIVPSLVDTVAAADYDGDGLADTEDPDIDNDGLLNVDEDTLGTNPFNNDSDGDGAPDGVDNCPATSNADQSDVDADGQGDACVDDDDADGLSDSDELKVYGSNPHSSDSDGDGLSDPYEVLTSLTDPTVADSDGDGVDDGVDAYPLDDAEWQDTDGDGVGDNHDNCPNIVNPDQQNTDANYAEQGLLAPDGLPVEPDALGDACDDDLDGDRNIARFVDANVGDDDNLGTFYEPVKSLTRAMALAATDAHPIMLAAGRYNTAEVQWFNGAQLHGGYAAGFGSRVPRSEDPGYATELYAPTGSAVVALEDVQDLGFSGVIIAPSDSDVEVASVHVSSSGVAIEDSIIYLPEVAPRAFGVDADTQSALTIERSMIRTPDDAAVEDAVAMRIHESTARIVNNAIYVMGGLHAQGVVIEAESPILLHNTVVVGGEDAATAYASVLRADAVVLSNNVLVTTGAEDQATMLCAEGSASEATLRNNVVATFGGLGPQPVAIDCSGTYITAAEFSSEDPPVFSESILEAHQLTSVASLADLLDDTSFALLDTNVQHDADADLDFSHEVQHDFYGVAYGATPSAGAVQ